MKEKGGVERLFRRIRRAGGSARWETVGQTLVCSIRLPGKGAAGMDYCNPRAGLWGRRAAVRGALRYAHKAAEAEEKAL